MSIALEQVKELRELTGAGMMECKKALMEANGNINTAIEIMRKSGMAKAASKSDRTAAEGVVIIKTTPDRKKAVMAEINCETDFVARDENFLHFVDQIGNHLIKASHNSIAELMAQKEEQCTLEELRLQLVAKVGEKIDVRRFEIMETNGIIGSYVHGGRVGALVSLTGGNADVAKDIAMQIVATKPLVVNSDEVPADLIAKEKEIYRAQTQDERKPAEIIEKIVSGRVAKFLDEVSLVGQPFVKDPDIKVGALLKKHQATVERFVCFSVGEGIEKKAVNFHDEVMAQIKGA